MRKATGRTEGERFITTAIEANGLVFTTGNIGLDPETGELPDDVERQTTNTLLTLEAVLHKAGTDVSKLIKVNVFLDQIDADFDRMNGAYDEFFRARGIEEPPARTTVGARLPWSKVEMDMVALA
jgi:2-iminobutanoate/2-iminopropanoate deaminase